MNLSIVSVSLFLQSWFTEETSISVLFWTLIPYDLFSITLKYFIEIKLFFVSNVGDWDIRKTYLNFFFFFSSDLSTNLYI